MHTRSTQTASDELVAIQLTNTEIEVKWPRPVGLFDGFDFASTPPAPDPLIARDGDGWLTLTTPVSNLQSASSLQHSEQVIKYRRGIASGANGVDYRSLNGMRTEIEGLARWAKMSSVTTVLHRETSSEFSGISLTARNQPDRELGGPLGLRLRTMYSHQPSPADGQYTIDDRLTVETRSRSRRDWEIHAAQHRMLQDLMCLVYSHPCSADLVAVTRTDDHYRVMRESSPNLEWRQAFEPTFGRGDGSTALPAKREPLFFLDEADPVLVAKWLSEFQRWSRPTWIAVTTLFQRSSSIEAELLQVGVALESLGYALYSQGAKSRRRQNFVDYLESVTGRVGIASEALYGKSRRARTWRVRFNRAYKGAKHADNPLVKPQEAFDCARQGLRLIRSWLALELGVPRPLVRARLEEVNRGERP